MKIIKLLTQFNIYQLLIFSFPVILLLRSFIINSYLILISVITLYFILKKKINVPKVFNYFFIFYVYIILISFFSDLKIDSFKSSLSQIRFVLFAIFIIHFLNYSHLLKIKFYLIFFLFLVIFDTYFQFFFGQDIIGFEYDKNYFRLSGPFGDEYVVGYYIAVLSLLVLGLFKPVKKNRTDICLYFILAFFLIFTVLLTGERTSFLIIFFGTILLNYKVIFDKKIILFFLIPLFISFFLLFNHSLLFKSRYIEAYNFAKNIHSSSYGRIYSSAIKTWSDNKLIGVGLKNYRHYCKQLTDPNSNNKFPYCSSHPHNYVLELLAETGLIGLSLFLLFILKVFKDSTIFLFKSKKNKNNNFLFSTYILLILYIWPIKTSGSIFTTFNGSIFWFTLGLLLIYQKKKDL
jgi:O-antigen ligase